MKLSRRRLRRILSILLLAVSIWVLLTQSNNPPVAVNPLKIPSSTPDQQATPEPDSLVQTTTGAILGAQPGLAEVTKAVDGDTINVTFGGQAETVRLIGIDTPETHDPRRPVQCFGEVASAYTKQVLEGKSVRLEPDPTNSNRDKYGRLLRYVYLPDGTLINAQIIATGHAFAYTVFPFTKLEDFRVLEQQARSNNSGLWAGCNIDESQTIKQTTTTR